MSVFTNLKTNKLFISLYNFYYSKKNINGVLNKIIVKDYVYNKSRVKIMGDSNIIEFSEKSFLDVDIFIKGNNNRIFIGKNCSLKKCRLWIEDNENSIIINNNSSIEYNTELATVEGKNIVLGEDCMLSSNIVIRTTDSHSITDLNGKRINFGGNVEIRDHVWIGNNVTINKNVIIGNNNIISSNSLVTKSFVQSNCIIGGVPSQIIKERVNWLRKRI